MVRNDKAALSPARTAQSNIAWRNPSVSAAGSFSECSDRPAAEGSRATAIIPPKYATWLLIAEAVPENSTGAEAKAVAVRGGTVRLSPKPRTRTPGSTAVVNRSVGVLVLGLGLSLTVPPLTATALA